MARCISWLSFPFLFLLAFFSAQSAALAQNGTCPISVTSLNGSGNVSVGATPVKGDTLKTGKGSFMQLSLGNGALLKLGPESVLSVDVAYCPDASTRAFRLKLISGSLWAQGHTSVPRFEVSTAHFLATVGTSNLVMHAKYLDTTFTLDKESQKIATRDWEDTVNVLSHTFPFKGEVSRLFMVKGTVEMIPWGGNATTFKQGEQVAYGYKDYHIANTPTAIIKSELPFDAEGNYLWGK